LTLFREKFLEKPPTNFAELLTAYEFEDKDKYEFKNERCVWREFK
jgi:hypothetical protein